MDIRHELTEILSEYSQDIQDGDPFAAVSAIVDATDKHYRVDMLEFVENMDWTLQRYGRGAFSLVRAFIGVGVSLLLTAPWPPMAELLAHANVANPDIPPLLAIAVVCTGALWFATEISGIAGELTKILVANSHQISARARQIWRKTAGPGARTPQTPQERF